MDYFGNVILEELGLDLDDVKKVWTDLQAYKDNAQECRFKVYTLQEFQMKGK